MRNLDEYHGDLSTSQDSSMELAGISRVVEIYHRVRSMHP